VTITLDLTPYVQLTRDQFFDLCRQHPDLKIERKASGEVQLMPPAGGESGGRNAELTYHLVSWARLRPDLGRAFDSSTGWTLPNGAVRSPDASWVARERWESLTAEERNKFAPLCPDFVVELLSPSDSLPQTQAKMLEYLANGARLGWLLDPERDRIEIYRPGHGVELVEVASGYDVLPGFTLRLTDIGFWK
jgi:Uma2 family endonuclease